MRWRCYGTTDPRVRQAAHQRPGRHGGVCADALTDFSSAESRECPGAHGRHNLDRPGGAEDPLALTARLR
jgi:hypothetical protein